MLSRVKSKASRSTRFKIAHRSKRGLGGEPVRNRRVAVPLPLRVKTGSVGASSSFPLYPTKQTSTVASARSVSCQQETHAPPQTTALFDHLVGALQQRCRHFDAKRLCGLQIDHQFELGRLLDRQVARLRTLENLVDEDGGPAR